MAAIHQFVKKQRRADSIKNSDDRTCFFLYSSPREGIQNITHTQTQTNFSTRRQFIVTAHRHTWRHGLRAHDFQIRRTFHLRFATHLCCNQQQKSVKPWSREILSRKIPSNNESGLDGKRNNFEIMLYLIYGFVFYRFTRIWDTFCCQWAKLANTHLPVRLLTMCSERVLCAFYASVRSLKWVLFDTVFYTGIIHVILCCLVGFASLTSVHVSMVLCVCLTCVQRPHNNHNNNNANQTP